MLETNASRCRRARERYAKKLWGLGHGGRQSATDCCRGSDGARKSAATTATSTSKTKALTQSWPLQGPRLRTSQNLSPNEKPCRQSPSPTPKKHGCAKASKGR